MSLSVPRFLQTAIFQRQNLKMDFQTRVSRQVKISKLSHSILTNNPKQVVTTINGTSGQWKDSDMWWAVFKCNKFLRPNRFQTLKYYKKPNSSKQISESHFLMNILWNFTEISFRCNTIIKLNFVVVTRIDFWVYKPQNQQYARAFSVFCLSILTCKY